MRSSDTYQYKTLRSLKADGLFLRRNSYEPGWSYKHSHENARFVFVLKGAFEEVYSQRKRSCKPIMLIFRPPGEEHREDFASGGVICLSVDISSSWIDRLREHSVRFASSADFRSVSLTTLALKLDHELTIGDDASVLAIEGLLLEIAIEAFRQKHVNAQRKAPRWLGVAKDFIHEEFAHNLTLAEVSAAAGVHRVHLARVFQQYCRCTIGQYLRQLRVEAACAAIAKSDAPLSEIAVASGFSDQSHLCRTFKRLIRMTPAEYRQLYRLR